MDKFKAIFISVDFLIAVIAVVLLLFLMPAKIDNVFAKDVYYVGISILSIVFSLFFAALAIIVSSSDDEFVKFLEKDNVFTEIVELYKIVLAELLLGLVYTFIIFGLTAYKIAHNLEHQNRFLFLIFVFLFIYGIFAVFSTILNSIKYARERSKFLSALNSNKSDED